LLQKWTFETSARAARLWRALSFSDILRAHRKLLYLTDSPDCSFLVLKTHQSKMANTPPTHTHFGIPTVFPGTINFFSYTVSIFWSLFLLNKFNKILKNIEEFGILYHFWLRFLCLKFCKIGGTEQENILTIIIKETKERIISKNIFFFFFI